MVEEPEQKPERPRPQLTPEQQAQRQAAMRIADALGERVTSPRAQVGRVVRVLGIERAEAFYQQALEVEAAGGMMLPDGSRRRTPGGVFFKLVRDGVSEEERLAIFPPQPWQKQRGERPPSAAPGAPSAPLPPVPQPLLIDLPNLTGEARTVKITLVGRPGRIVAKQGYIITSMEHAKVPSLPKGMPVPPTKPTTYTVYIGQKQWAKVAEALRDPEDVLIAEGTPVYDPALEGIAVYVTNASTKLLQQKQRAAQS
ncbi:MAG: phosphorylated adapter RNA export RNA-binding domain-containing protein [Chloroflexota bacterium]|nr:phosphorylated adapter RNA export RNA-binding domain-containing protein [Chloroflexota bacterium]